MAKGFGGLGGGATAMAAGGFAAAVLALGAWIGASRENGPVPTAPDAEQQAALQPAPKLSQPADPAAEPAVPAATADPVPEAAEPDSAEVTADTAPATFDSAQTPDADQPETTAPEATAPAFDEVRRESDGMTVIAGRAAPGAQVKVLQDGTEVASATADGSGKFATLAMIAPDGQGHVLSLEQTTEQGMLASVDEILLAPLDAPVMAEAAAAPKPAAPDAQAEPTPDPAAIDPAPDTATAPTPDTTMADSADGTSDMDNPESAAVGDAPTEPATITPAAETPTTPATETPTLAETTTDPQVAHTVAPITGAEAVQGSAPETATVDSAGTTTATAPTPEAETASAEPTAAPTETTPAEPAPVAVLKSTAEGVERIDTAPPQVMTNVALDTISYSDEGAVQLAGRAQQSAKQVRVYLNNNAIISLPVDSEGRWRGDLPAVDAGVYNLRVDELSQDGSVISRVETPFKRESPAVLAAASADQDGPLTAVTVQKGDTLWAISRTRYGDPLLYVRVFEANAKSIRDPDLIYPGQVFDLPE